jgi:two-component system chemotaxis response regulator CheB
MTYELVCIGASWGGLHAVGQVLSGFPEDIDLPIVVAQHRHPDSQEGALRELLQLRTDRLVHDVEDKMAIEPRHVYITPPDYHVLVQRGSFALSVDDRVQFARPSIDVLFESAADAYGAGVIGVILTGASADGSRGLARIKQQGGVALIQDPVGAARRTMPDAAIATTVADAVLPLEEIGKFVYGLSVAPTRAREAAKPPVRASGPVEGVPGNREVPPMAATHLSEKTEA